MISIIEEQRNKQTNKQKQKAHDLPGVKGDAVSL